MQLRVHNCMSITETKDGVIITIFVKPNSPKFKVEMDGDEIVVHSTEEPVKGKVNKEILKEFTKLLHAKVELVSGATSKEKQLFVKGVRKAAGRTAFAVKTKLMLGYISKIEISLISKQNKSYSITKENNKKEGLTPHLTPNQLFSF